MPVGGDPYDVTMSTAVLIQPARLSQSSWLRGGLAAYALLAALAALASANPRPEEVAVGWLGWLLAPGLAAAVLLAGRRWPVLTLLISVVMLFAYYSTNRPPIGLELLLAPAMVNVAERGRLRAGAFIAVAVLIAAYTVRIVVTGQELRILGVQFITTLVVLVGSLGCGEALRVRTAWQVESERAHRAELDAQAAEIAGHLDAERHRIARDIHDMLGHTLVVVGQQAAIAAATMDSEPDKAKQALGLVGTTLRQARGDVRDAVQLLRSGEAEPLNPSRGLGDLPELAELIGHDDLEVRFRVDSLPVLGTALDTTAYRIIQEALTNVHRHSDATVVEVGVSVGTDQLTVTVADNGNAATPMPTGTGIRGMTERAHVLGGTLTVSGGAEGVVVVATLPAGQR